MAEVTHISRHGIWLLLDNKELFLPHDDYPEFQDADAERVRNVQRLRFNHLQWPDLDMTLEIQSLGRADHPPVARRM